MAVKTDAVERVGGPRAGLVLLGWVALALCASCRHGAGSTEPSRDGAIPDAPSGTTGEATDVTFEAVLNIDDEAGYKRFQGVWLERGDGGRWLIDYRAKPWWRDFEGQRVKVRGRRYAPQGQAVLATHFEVDSLEPLSPPVDAPRRLGAELELRGRFERHTWPAGTKLEGESSTVFADEAGRRFWLAGAPTQLPEPGAPVRIRAREVEPSPFVSRPGGPYLWVVAFRAGGESEGGWTEADYERR